MPILPYAAAIDGPAPLLTRVAAHVANAESRDLVFTTLPVAIVRELLTLAGGQRTDAIDCVREEFDR